MLKPPTRSRLGSVPGHEAWACHGHHLHLGHHGAAESSGELREISGTGTFWDGAQDAVVQIQSSEVMIHHDAVVAQGAIGCLDNTGILEGDFRQSDI